MTRGCFSSLISENKDIACRMLAKLSGGSQLTGVALTRKSTSGPFIMGQFIFRVF
jgi:hypothetical protein